jgi:hypothetical protein
VWQSYPNYLDLRDRNRSFEDLAAFNIRPLWAGHGQGSCRRNGFATTGNYFDVLHIQPYLGQFLSRSDEHGPNSAPYIVLTYAYWHSHFQDDRGVVGRTVQLDKHPYTIIGVAPPGFQGTLLFVSPDFFMPIVNQGSWAEEIPYERGNTGGVFEVFGHLKPGVTPAQAAADVNAVGAIWKRPIPKLVIPLFAVIVREGLTFFGGPVRGICCRLGAARRLDSAGRMRQPGKPVCGARRRPIARSGSAPRARFQPQAHPAATVDRSRADFARGGALGLLGSESCCARLSTWQPFRGSRPSTRDSGCKTLRGGVGSGVGERIPLRHCSRCARCSAPIRMRSSKRDRARGWGGG